MLTSTFNQQQNKSLRRQLRQQPIICEKILWQKIRNRQLDYKFKRQFGIDKYIVDFYCPRLELVIEIDGATHGTEAEVKYDEKRQRYLESKGLVVKRYLNVDIKNNLRAVLWDIKDVCDRIANEKPHPNPLLAKERE
jgi:very-short-patch-repair endonuclease